MPIHHLIFIMLFSYLIIKHLLRIVYLLFKPKFLSAEKFGMPSKSELFTYYLFFIMVCTGALLFYLGVFDTDSMQMRSKLGKVIDFTAFQNVWIVMSLGVVMILIEIAAFAYILKQKKGRAE